MFGILKTEVFNMVEKQRLTALKLRLADISKGKFVPAEGLKPAYVLTPDGRRAGRVRIVATAVNRWQSNDKSLTVLTLDDGTDTIRAKAFGSLIFENFRIGDIIEVVGKLRFYNNELYIAPEVAWAGEPNAELLRELELRQQAREWEQKRLSVIAYAKQTSDAAELRSLAEEMGIPGDDAEAIIEAQELRPQQEPGKEELKLKIIETIEKLDSGEGCGYDDLLANVGIAEATLDGLVQELLDDGMCFEPRPGKIKKVSG
jgi:RPA family protein